MSKKIYDEKIDKYIDWGGDEKTSNLPVSGNRVQEFIKSSLESKAGVFYYDTTNNRYLVFSDEDNRDLYLEDPTKTDLLLGSFDAPFNYNANINLLSPTYNAILLNSTNNNISFTFSITNKSGQETGDNVICVYTFINGATKQTVSARYRAGETANINIDKYLKEGTNNIIIGITGEDTLAATTISITYQVINLKINNVFDISKTYNSDDILETTCVVEGYGTKIIEWYVDGTKLALDSSIDEITSLLPTSRTRYINLNNLGSGIHSLQMRVYTTINGEKFYSQTLYREFIIRGIDKGVTVSCELPIGVVADSRALLYMTQYEEFPISISAYSASNHKSNINIYINSDLQSSLTLSNGDVENINLVSTEYNSIDDPGILKITIDDQEFIKDIYIEKSDIALEEITNKLQLYLTAVGKINSSDAKDVWNYNDISAKFSGFNWNEYSGWNNDYLVISENASVTIPYAPLKENIVNTGKTIEIEFASSNVIDDDVVFLDLINDKGTGLKITSSEATIISAAGDKLSTKYKSDERIRVSFVVNRKNSIVEQGLMYLYVNGILCGASNYDTDSDFMSAKQLKFVGNPNATLLLKSIRIYGEALTAEQILNNYALYSDSHDRLNIVLQNDILEGNKFDYNKLANQLPVMIITGNIPVLEDTTDKNTSIVVDIDYINNQTPEYSFVLKNAQMKPQGTSSMGYPKKNFRFYTNKRDDTKLYNYEGKIVEDRLYAFKPGATPVNCWCLKADYAESSGTHNTGVARLWNDAMKNTRYNNEYVLRTGAQKSAIENNYKYDVRTTVDGFPIVVFYRLTTDSDLIFIGKYNFNNDKSTESVFGFKDIPGFDNSKMQCWEFLNNGSPLALFNSVENFDTEWSDAFESRYPDSKNPSTLADLKSFCTWVNTTTDFKTSKWDHLDIYKVAAYYIYLMRFGAVDQVVKNAMLASEDGKKYYFINYDNDTILGLRNDGPLEYNPTITRQTPDESVSGSYCYAGHDSKLWNLLEADDEFMSIVSKIDNALYESGLTYENVINMFNDKQAGQWCERVYNEDSKYKYIIPYTQSHINNLFMCQGNRNSHREWWLSKRFAIYDAEFASGSYKSESIFTKFAELVSTPESPNIFKITSGNLFKYGYGINNDPIEYGVSLNKNESHEFKLTRTINVGDPVRIYGSYYIKELDFSNISSNMTQLDLTNIKHKLLGTKLTKLILGNSGENNALTSISGLENANQLEYLDIQGFKSIKTLDVSSLSKLGYVNASRSGISSLSFSDSGQIYSIQCPALSSLSIKNSEIDLAGVVFDNNDFSNLKNLYIKNCPQLLIWEQMSVLLDRLPGNKQTSIYLEGVSWSISMPDLLKFEKTTPTIKGVINVVNFTPSDIESYRGIVDRLKNLFGETIFDPQAELYINIPSILYIEGPTSILEGQNAQYNSVVYPEIIDTYTDTWTISNVYNRPDYNISSGGLLTTQENNIVPSRDVTIRLTRKYSNGKTYSATKDLTVNVRTYPSKFNLTIPTNIIKPNTDNKYILSIDNTDCTGEYNISWNKTGDLWDHVTTTIGQEDNKEYLNIHSGEIISSMYSGSFEVEVKKKWNDEVLFTKTVDLDYLSDDIIITTRTNPQLMDAMYSAGFTANQNYMSKAEAEAVTELNPDVFKDRSISFDEFKYFTGITTIPDNLFRSATSLSRITLPKTITTIGNSPFPDMTRATIDMSLCEELTELAGDIFNNLRGNIYFAPNITSSNLTYNITYRPNVYIKSENLNKFLSIQNQDGPWFDKLYVDNELLTQVQLADINVGTILKSYKYITSVIINDNVILSERSFSDCTNLTSLLVNGLTDIPSYAFYKCSISNFISTGITSVGELAFYNNSNIRDLNLPNCKTIASAAFWGCGGKNENGLRISFGPKMTDVTFGSNGIVPAFEAGRVYSIEVSDNSYYTVEAGLLIRDVPAKTYIPTESSSTIYKTVLLSTYNSSTIPDGVNAIGTNAFLDTALGQQDIVLPESVKYIGWNAYQNSNIMTISGVGVTHIDRSVFSSCNYIKTFNFPNLVKTNTYTCSSSTIQTVTIPKSCTLVGYLSFQKCPKLTDVVFEGTGEVAENRSGMFNNDTALTNVTLRKDTKYIYPEWFIGCTGLKNIDIPLTVQIIYNSAFEGAGLTKITLPETLNTLGDKVFKNCKNLSVVEFKSLNAPIIGVDTFLNCGSEVTGSKYFKIPKGNSGYENIKAILVDQLGFELIETKYGYPITKESNPALMTIMHNSGLATSEDFMTWDEVEAVTSDQIDAVKFDETLISFDEFQYFTNVTQISRTFNNCYNLKHIILPESLTKIFAYTFQNCHSLTSIHIPKNTSVETGTFYNCPGIESMTVDSMNKSFASINNCIFNKYNNYLVAGCQNSIIPENITLIEWAVFYGCDKLKSITIPKNCTTIKLTAFTGCTNLSEIICLNPEAPTIDTDAFGTQISNWVGYKSGVDNKLYIPTGAAGYDSGAWLDPLQSQTKCKFTLKYAHDESKTQTIYLPSSDARNETDENTKIPNWAISQWTDSNFYQIVSGANSDPISTGHCMLGINIKNLENFTLYIKSNGADDCCVLVGELDTKPTITTYKSKTTTQSLNDLISEYTMVEFLNIDSTTEHKIYVSYYKPSRSHKNDDRGYILIPSQYIES